MRGSRLGLFSRLDLPSSISMSRAAAAGYRPGGSRFRRTAPEPLRADEIGRRMKATRAPASGAAARRPAGTAAAAAAESERHSRDARAFWLHLHHNRTKSGGTTFYFFGTLLSRSARPMARDESRRRNNGPGYISFCQKWPVCFCLIHISGCAGPTLNER